MTKDKQLLYEAAVKIFTLTEEVSRLREIAGMENPQALKEYLDELKRTKKGSN